MLRRTLLRSLAKSGAALGFAAILSGPPAYALGTSAATVHPAASTVSDWLVSDSAVASMENAGLTVSSAVSHFDRPSTFLITHNVPSVDGQLPHATRVAYFTSAASLMQALTSSSIPAGTGALLYDAEAWSLTPVAEQQQPFVYAAAAERAAHAHGYMFIFTPGSDLARVGVAPGTRGDNYHVFIARGMAASAAAVADVYDIQAQEAETTSEFAWYVQSAVSQAEAAGHRPVFLAGISTNPLGHVVTETVLDQAMNSVSGIVSGFWLNIPSGGVSCPSCGTPQPGPANSMLQGY